MIISINAQKTFDKIPPIHDKNCEKTRDHKRVLCLIRGTIMKPTAKASFIGERLEYFSHNESRMSTFITCLTLY